MSLDGAPSFSKESVKHYSEKGWWSGIPIGEMLDRTSALYPEKEALVAEGVRLTYAELKKWTDRAALCFHELGLGTQDRVLLQVPNWAEFVYAYYGLEKIGAIPVFCIPRYSQREIEHFSDLTEAKAWIVPLRYEKIEYLPLIRFFQSRPSHLKQVLLIDSHETERAPLPEGTLSFDELLQKACPEKFPPDLLSSLRPDPEEICHLMPTGGSTGLPKIVPRTHNDFFCNFKYRAKAWQRSPQDITLIATPLAHNMAIEVSMNPTFLTGGKVVLLPSTRPKEILEAIERERVTHTILVVAQLQQIVDFPDLGRYDLSSLRAIAGAGSHVPAELIKKIWERFPCKFFNVFGMSEGPCAQTRYEDPEEVVLHTVGRPICPYDEFKVIDARGQTLPQGEEGELVARGPCIFRGYYKAEEENREAFTADGFFRTGDIARFDERGNLVITGRRKDIIVRGGEKISAREVEELISGHPKVAQVAAVGMPDRLLGERVCAFIKPKAGTSISFDEIISFLKEKKTAVLYLPERIEVIEEMPLTPVGKVDKRRLRETIETELGKDKGA